MIGTLLRIGFINLRRDRVVQALVFVLPVMFFSIFATVFGNQRDATSRIPVPVADEEQSEYSRKLVKALAAEGGLRVLTTKDGAKAQATEGAMHVQTGNDQEGSGRPLTRQDVEALVRGGSFSVGIVLPKGFSEGNRLWQREASGAKGSAARGRLRSHRSPDGDGAAAKGQLHSGARDAGDRRPGHAREVRRPTHAPAERIDGYVEEGAQLAGCRARRKGRRRASRVADRARERDAARRRQSADRLVLCRGNRRHVPAVLVLRRGRSAAR